MQRSDDVASHRSDDGALGGGPQVLVLAHPDLGTRIERWITDQPVAASVDQCDRFDSIDRSVIYDCVVLELGGESVDGDPAVLERLRATYPGTALITLVDTEEMATTALGDGADEYIVKDALDQSSVARAVRDAQQRRAASDAGVARRCPVEAIPYPVVQMSVSGEPFFVNTAAVDLLGYPDTMTLLETPIDEVLADPDDFARFSEPMIRDGFVAGEEIEFRRYNGKPIWVVVMGHEVEDLDGPYWQVVVVDVSARRRAEQAAQESEDRFRTVFEQSPVALWEEDFSALEAWFEDLRSSGIRDFRRHLHEYPEEIVRAFSLIRVVDVNPAGVAMVGAADKQQLLGPLQPFANADGQYLDVLTALWEGRTHFETDVTGETIDGRIVNHTLHMAVTVVDEQLDLSFVIVAVSDTTGRSRLERDLIDAKALFQHAFESAPIGMMVFDRCRQLTDVNSAFCDLTGRSASELISTNWTEMVHQDDVSDVHSCFADSVELASGPKEINCRVVRSDGTLAWVTARGSVAVDLNGEPSNFIVHLLDKSDLRRCMSELTRLRAHALAPPYILSREGLASDE